MSLGRRFWGKQLYAVAMLWLCRAEIMLPKRYAIRLVVPISLSSLFFRRRHRKTNESKQSVLIVSFVHPCRTSLPVSERRALLRRTWRKLKNYGCHCGGTRIGWKTASGTSVKHTTKTLMRRIGKFPLYNSLHNPSSAMSSIRICLNSEALPEENERCLVLAHLWLALVRLRSSSSSITSLSRVGWWWRSGICCST